MSSKFIDPSLTVIGVVGSIAISVGSVLAETGVFPRFGSKVVNVMWILCIKRSWRAWGMHECMDKKLNCIKGSNATELAT